MRVPVRIATAAVVAAALAIPAAAPAVASADYGAAAVNPRTGAWGVGYGYSTLGAARRRAERECRGNCRVIVWTHNRCGAVVQTPTRFVGGHGSTKRRATSHAKHRAGTKRVRLVTRYCSG